MNSIKTGEKLIENEIDKIDNAAIKLILNEMVKIKCL